MKTKIILSGAALATLFIFSCNNETKKETTDTEEPTQTTATAATAATAGYTCPMHPDVKSDKPSQCPQCGMDLEPVEKTDSVSH